MAEKTETPMMKQFNDIKRQYPDAMLLFRCGDFYETYCEDAVRASKVLGITLTHRSNGGQSAGGSIEMAGFPFHALDAYLPKLVRAGMRVAICDQLEDPKLTKKLVKRGVTELVTPGVSYSDATLQNKENNFVCCVHFAAKEELGIAFLDISTGEFMLAEGHADYIEKLLTNFSPKEVLFLRGKKQQFESLFGCTYFTYELEDWMLTHAAAEERLLKQFETTTLKGFGVAGLPNGVIAAGAILQYLDMTQHLQTGHISHLARIEADRYMWLDRFSMHNLELFPREKADRDTSLLGVIDKTITPMGGRMMRRWLAFPLKDVKHIQQRQSVVEYSFKEPELYEAMREHLEHLGDVERMVSRVSTGRISPREMVQLGLSLQAMEPIREIAVSTDCEYLVKMAEKIALCTAMRERIQRTMTPNPPSMQGRPDMIAQGVDAELDELRAIRSGGKQYLLDIQQREIEKTGIQSLKIGFNNVFGYYLEVRNTYKDMVPQDWIRKQTLAQAERYITEELKEYEQKILTAEEKIQIIENRIYQELMLSLVDYVPAIQMNSQILAQIDCLLSFGQVAKANHYVCPVVNDSLTLEIKQGRHPVIERMLPAGETYVPNDVLLDNNGQQVIIITGPNMAGKSALLRQTALIVLLAQTGSFVPAESATIGIVDKIFTRVGASDNIAVGESTFMVEMNEAAAILNNLSERSLVLFDELGRGTSTYDGISIAWAIVEYIHDSRQKAKTLFATHYHELNDLAETLQRVRNYNVSVREVNKKVIFLRKLVPGGSEHSFGIHVAKMAGMPKTIVDRAEKILHTLEKQSKEKGTGNKLKVASPASPQLSFFQLEDPVLEQIRDEFLHLDVNNLTPLEALNKLNDLKHIISGK